MFNSTRHLKSSYILILTNLLRTEHENNVPTHALRHIYTITYCRYQ